MELIEEVKKAVNLDMSIFYNRFFPQSIIGTRALSIRQPWASAIVRGGKDIENRTWETKHRGYIYIHASKSNPTKREVEEYLYFIDRNGLSSVKKDESGEYETDFDKPENNVALPPFALGGIIGIAKIVNCKTISGSRWFTGPFGFVLEDVFPLPFIPCKGKLGFFDVLFTPEQESQIFKAMGGHKSWPNK